MTYVKQVWHDDPPSTDTPIDKATLDHIEDGLWAAHYNTVHDATADNQVPIVARGFSGSQSADLFQAARSDGLALGAFTKDGAIRVTLQNAAAAAATLQGAAGQTADLQQNKNSAGTILSRFTKDGALSVELALASAVAAVLKAAAGQTGDLLQNQSSAGATLSKFTKDGALQILLANNAVQALILKAAAGQATDLLQAQGSGGGILTQITQDGAVKVSLANTAAVAAILKGAAGQTGDLQQNQDSTGAILSRFLADGSLRFSADATLARSAASTLKSADAGLWATGGLITKTKAGVPVDADVVAGMRQDGLLLVDTTNSRLYARIGGAYVNMSGSGGGGSPFIASADNVIALIAQGHSLTQSADIFQVLLGDGTTKLMWVDASKRFRLGPNMGTYPNGAGDAESNTWDGSGGVLYAPSKSNPAEWKLSIPKLHIFDLDNPANMFWTRWGPVVGGFVTGPAGTSGVGHVWGIPGSTPYAGQPTVSPGVWNASAKSFSMDGSAQETPRQLGTGTKLQLLSAAGGYVGFTVSRPGTQALEGGVAGLNMEGDFIVDDGLVSGSVRSPDQPTALVTAGGSLVRAGTDDGDTYVYVVRANDIYASKARPSGYATVIPTLTAAINSSQTTIPVSQAGAPAKTPFTITIGSEKMSVTGISGLTLTVTRGFSGTTAASHSSGDQITGLVDGTDLPRVTASNKTITVSWVNHYGTETMSVFRGRIGTGGVGGVTWERRFDLTAGTTSLADDGTGGVADSTGPGTANGGNLQRSYLTGEGLVLGFSNNDTKAVHLRKYDPTKSSVNKRANLQIGLGIGGGGNADGCVFIANAAVIPSANPTGGAVMWAEGGAIKARGGGGTVTTMAPA